MPFLKVEISESFFITTDRPKRWDSSLRSEWQVLSRVRPWVVLVSGYAANQHHPIT